MIRYEIQAVKPGIIIESDLIRKVIATRGVKALVVVYIRPADSGKFRKMLDDHPGVEKYTVNTVGN